VLATLACFGCRREDARRVDTEATEESLEELMAEPNKLIPSHRDAPLPDSRVIVELPPSIAFPSSEAPLVHPDGAYSVRGLREHVEQQLAAGKAPEQSIRVRAWVVSIHPPGPGCPKALSCLPSHVFVADAPELVGARLSLLVALPRHEYWWEEPPAIPFVVGQEVELEGKVVRRSDSGLRDERGLLQLGGPTPED
jgi:hypothetical protein